MLQHVKKHTKVLKQDRKSGPMQDAHDTNMGWWTDKPDRPERRDRNTGFAPLRVNSAREERVWAKATVVVAIMIAFGLSLLRLASQFV